MRPSLCFFLWLLLIVPEVFAQPPTEQMGELFVTEVVDPFEPVVVTFSAEKYPEGSELRIRWNPSAQVKFVALPNHTVYVWAPPGNHSLEAVVTSIQFETIKVTTPTGEREVKIFKNWDVQHYVARFKIRDLTAPTPPLPRPDPNPDPNPNPTPNPTPNDEFRTILLEGWNAAGKPPGIETIVRVYREVAEEANQHRDVFKPAVMLDHAKTRLSTELPIAAQASWRPFWVAFAKALNTLQLDDQDLNAYIDAFRKVADILETFK